MIRQTVRAEFSLALARSASPPPPARWTASQGLARRPPRLRSRRRSRRRRARPPTSLRDRYRHPYETLAFFGVRPSDTVVEIWPGGGWYTEILAPYCCGAAAPIMRRRWPASRRRSGASGARDAGALRRRSAPPSSRASTPRETRVPDGSADVVLTFRNVHNWRMGYQREHRSIIARRRSARSSAMLRPAARSAWSTTACPRAPTRSASGPAATSRSRPSAGSPRPPASASSAASEVNANPRDTADWPDGVWTLPPALRLGDQRPRALPRDRRERPDDPAVREAAISANGDAQFNR